VTIHVCGSDRVMIGEFEELDFREAVFNRRVPPDSYYWHEGMEDWRPIAEYRALAKTQRISFAPPMKRTVKIDMEPVVTAQTPKPSGSISRLWRRLTGK